MAFVTLPPNLQDMFYSLTDRIAKLETGPNQAMYTAEAAQGSSAQASNEAAQALTQAQAANALGVQALAEADIAIAQGTQAIQTANEALQTANTSYALSSQAIIKSASTITNASNQLTAINGNGITVYSGASSTSGARVVLNSAGLAGFNSGGTATFAIDASTGAVNTNGAIFTSSTITGGSLNIGGNAIINTSGFLTATGATITGNITATSGTFTGVVNATSGSFTGTITSSNATITGGSLSVGGNFIVTSAGVLTATGANITGAITATSGTISGALTVTGSLTGGTVQTSSGSAAVILNGSSNAIQFKTSGSVVGNIVPLSSFGVLTHYGSTPDPSGGTFPQMFVGSSNVSMFASSTIGIGVATGTGVNINGNTALNNQTTYPGIATGAGSTMVVVTTGSRMAYTTSSERFKQDISYITSVGWLDKVLSMKPITYKTSVDFTTAGEPNETQIGFLAEDIADIGGGLETAVILDPLGDPFSLSYDRLTVFLTLAIKEIDARLKILEGK